MIIYHAKLCREYPILADQIQKKCKNHYQFHEPFEIVDKNLYIKNNGVLNYHPNQKIPNIAYYPFPDTITKKPSCFIYSDLNGLVPHPKSNSAYNINFIYGIFPSSRLKNENNFIFTVLDNPIEMLYNNLYYFKFSTLPNTQNLLKQVIGIFFQQPIEILIDLFLEGKLQQEFLFKDIRYKLINEMFFIGDLSKYNYIAFRDSLNFGLSQLSLQIRTRLNCDKIDSKIIQKCNYRKNDLETYLKNDIEQYYIYKTKFSR